MRVLVTLAVVTAAVVLAPGGLSADPQLALGRLAPLTIRGHGFVAREPVVLRVRVGALARSYRATTTRNGTFVVVIRKAVGSRCNAIFVRATQRNGVTAVLRRPPLPQCLPARSA